MSAGRRGRRLEATVWYSKDGLPLGQRGLANGEIDKVEGTWLVRKLPIWGETLATLCAVVAIKEEL